jgi:hypothetical protein
MVDSITYWVNMLDCLEGKNDVFFEALQCIKNQIDEVN